ncbi:MAG TPA: putative Ig domain-containing protein, partial [Steroidobacteraceae bacterium]|nr:putative Ig domain-containing protein [Steroidobacteraceae bacterium]
MKYNTARIIRFLIGYTLLSLLSACGGGNHSDNNPAVDPPTALLYPTPQTYWVGTQIAPLSPTVKGSVTSYSVSPAFPAGLVLNESTGQLSGTPTAATALSTYLVTAKNSGGYTSFSLSLLVYAALPTLTSVSPNSVPSSSSNISVAITGTGFTPTTRVTLGGQVL